MLWCAVLCRSYYMEQCVSTHRLRCEVERINHSKDFFAALPPMEGALQALREMRQAGLRVLLCTTPVMTSEHCAQEKIAWVRRHLGPQWLDRIVMCTDKTSVRGDLLVDDKVNSIALRA